MIGAIHNSEFEFVPRPIGAACLKKLQSDGCFAYDKVITVQRFFQPPNQRRLMLSVIIPTEGLEQPAVATLAALVPGAAAGVVREVLLVDRAGTGYDRTGRRCRRLSFPRLQGHARRRTRGRRRQARSPWLMFLHAGAVLGQRLDRGDHTIHRARIYERPAARRNLPLPPRSPYADPGLRDVSNSSAA